MKPALVVIDPQNGWLALSESLKRSVDEHVNNMSKAISIFRKAGAPIIFTYHSFPEKGIKPGTESFGFFSNIEVTSTDAKVVKTHQNAFNNTELEKLVREKQCDAVILVGLAALHCVLATYFGAYDRNLNPYLVRGAVAGKDEESVQIVEKICDTLSLRAISQILEQDTTMAF
jgi:nicotinamidase-related amidase